MKVPKFSIVLPTYNRADILPLAIQSVLTQTDGDFELIISNGGSTDNTSEIVRSFSDSRIRYFESSERRSMAQNYEYSLSLANGEYIIFFSDDDAFVPEMLEKVRCVIDRENAKMVVFPFARYYHEDIPEYGIKGNSIEFSAFTGEITTVRSSDDISRLSGLFGLSEQPVDEIKFRPLIGNVVLHHSIVQLLRTKTESLFATIPVDEYFIALVLHAIDHYHVFDEPLLAWSRWKHNASAPRMEGLRQHYERLLDGRKLDCVPLKFALPMNCGGNALLQASKEINGDITVPVDWKWYFVKAYENLIYLAAEGIETSKEITELKLTLEQQPDEVKKYFRDATIGTSFQRRQAFKKRFPIAVHLFRSMANMFRGAGDPNIGPGKRIIVNGNDHRFMDVLESARYLSSRL